MAKENRPFHEVIDIIRPQADLEYLREIESFSEEKQSIAYLDRNNTPDVWAAIAEAIKGSGHSVMITPSQPKYESLSFYSRPNPIGPHLFYHSAKRIFKRT